MKKMGIYRLRNTKNNKSYIGSSINLSSRKTRHFSYLRLNKHYNPHLQASYNKHGADLFVFEVIEEVLEAENLVSREQFWIDKESPEFNIRKIAQSNLGLKHTEEAKNKIRKNGNLGRKFIGKKLENIRNGAKNRKLSSSEKQKAAARKNIIEYNKSDKHRAVASKMGKLNGPKNIKKAHEKNRVPDNTRAKIIEDVKNGMMQKDAAVKYGYSKITICRIINNKRWDK